MMGSRDKSFGWCNTWAANGDASLDVLFSNQQVRSRELRKKKCAQVAQQMEGNMIKNPLLSAGL
jgi:hypothetical protein